MELSTNGLNKPQSKRVIKVLNGIHKFVTMFELNRGSMPKQIALPHPTYVEVMGYYENKPDCLTFRGIPLYDPLHPPKEPTL